jgi:high-affinity K+ transport system ATPase subunit B
MDAIVNKSVNGGHSGELGVVMPSVTRHPLVVSQKIRSWESYLRDILNRIFKALPRFRAMGIKTVMVTGDNPTRTTL